MLDIQDLADETLQEIFSNLSCAELARACHISRRLGSLAEYVLYRAPSVGGSQLNNQSLERLLRTILSRPVLARYIQHLTFEGLRFGPEHHPSPPSLSDITLFSSAANRRQLPYSMLQSNHHLQLLLHLVPNLHVLDMVREQSDLFDQFVMDILVHNPTRALPVGFRSLRHVHFSSNIRIGITSNMLMSLFRLPSIRTIMVHIEWDFTPAPYTGFSSTVTQLTLRSGSLSIWALSQIIRIPRALTHLSLVDWDIWVTGFHGHSLGLVLQSVALTLKHLQLSLCDYMNMSPTLIDDWHPNTIGSLRHWPVLTRLRCSLTLLLGRGPEVATVRLVDMLPLGIRELEIEADQHWTCLAALDQIVDLVDSKVICGLENLAVITVGRKLAGAVGPLSVKCSAAGVRLMVSPSWC